MENKEKISSKKTILIIILILTIIFGVLVYIYHKEFANNSGVTSNSGFKSTTTIYQNIKDYDNTTSNCNYGIIYEQNGILRGEENFLVTSNEELKTQLSKCYSKSIEYENYLSALRLNNKLTQEQIQERAMNNLFEDKKINKKPILEYFDDTFFENNNLAINTYLGGNSYQYITSVTKENSNATVNIKKENYNYGSVANPEHSNFIILDKDVNHVNFNIYSIDKTNSNNRIFDFPTLLIATIFIVLAVIGIVLFLVSKNNKNLEDELENKKNSKKIINIVIFVVLLLILIFSIILSIKTIKESDVMLAKLNHVQHNYTIN